MGYHLSGLYSPWKTWEERVTEFLAAGKRAAAIYTLIETAKLNGIDPQAGSKTFFRPITDQSTSRLADLLPWNWQPTATAAAAA